MSDASTKKTPDPVEPSAEALAEMPEIDPSKLRRRPGRGHHAHLRGGELEEIEQGARRAVSDAEPGAEVDVALDRVARDLGL